MKPAYTSITTAAVNLHHLAAQLRRLASIVARSAAFIAVLLTANAGAGERIDKFLQLASYAAIDYKQSCTIFFDMGNHRELNPVLGKQPSRGDMVAFAAGSIGVLYLASEILPEPWATIAIDSALTSEQWNIEDNARIINAGHRHMEAIPVVITLRF